MNRRPVSSSNLSSAGYDEASQTLEIEFNNGGIYQYFDVPRAVFDGLMSATSHGRFFHQHIRGVFRYARV